MEVHKSCIIKSVTTMGKLDLTATGGPCKCVWSSLQESSHLWDMTAGYLSTNSPVYHMSLGIINNPVLLVYIYMDQACNYVRARRQPLGGNLKIVKKSKQNKNLRHRAAGFLITSFERQLSTWAPNLPYDSAHRS